MRSRSLVHRLDRIWGRALGPVPKFEAKEERNRWQPPRHSSATFFRTWLRIFVLA